MTHLLKTAASLTGAALLCCSATPFADAQTSGAARRDALQRVMECRGIVEPTERLACYDANVRELDAARTRRDIVVVDREQVRETKRSLFGLNLPKLSIFGGGAKAAVDSKTAAKQLARDTRDEEEVDSIETTLASAQSTGLGQWLFVLADGARWVQADDATIGRKPKPGDKIMIHRAALGSFKLSINDGSAVRVRRVN
jgi:hypothetical protein